MRWKPTHRKHKHPAYKDPFNSYVWDDQINNKIIVVTDTLKGEHPRKWEAAVKEYQPFYHKGKRHRQVGPTLEKHVYGSHAEAFKEAQRMRKVY